jgi:2-iminobutanoate/2-iminopropanoate deaminase
MQKTFDNPGTVPAPAGHYTHVVKIDVGSGSLLMLSGQVAVDDDNKIVGPGDMTVQSRRVFDIIESILKAHGASFGDVVNIRSYLTDLGRIREYIDVRKTYFAGEPPSSTTIQVPRLFLPDALLEVEIVAAVGS